MTCNDKCVHHLHNICIIRLCTYTARITALQNNKPIKIILYRRNGSYEAIKLYGVYKVRKTDGNIV